MVSGHLQHEAGHQKDQGRGSVWKFQLHPQHCPGNWTGGEVITHTSDFINHIHGKSPYNIEVRVDMSFWRTEQVEDPGGW